jgi:hypothetical protein
MDEAGRGGGDGGGKGGSRWTRLKGDLADMMVQIAPKTYRKYITTDKNKKGTRILYVKLQKSTVRTNTSEPALLQETEKGTQGIWTCCESL